MDAGVIFEIIDSLVPKELALGDDPVGFYNYYLSDCKIKNIKVVMDLYPELDDSFKKTDLVISHHPPVFVPKTPTYVVHSNWDIVDGGANDALVSYLGLKKISNFDDNGIGRICSSHKTFDGFLNIIKSKFNCEDVRVVNNFENDKILKRIGIISGFGLSNLNYIKLAKSKNLDILVSGDLTHKGAILAKKLNISLIDISHYSIELPGLFALANLIESQEDIRIPVEIVDTGTPWSYLSNED